LGKERRRIRHAIGPLASGGAACLCCSNQVILRLNNLTLADRERALGWYRCAAGANATGRGAGALALLVSASWSLLQLELGHLRITGVNLNIFVDKFTGRFTSTSRDLDIIVDHWVPPGNWTSLASSVTFGI
jgi:hypothetical protein